MRLLDRIISSNAARAVILLAAIRLIIEMLVAIAIHQDTILVKSGFWGVAHEARTDYSMLLGSFFLSIVGTGPWSLDARLSPLVRLRRRA